MAYIIQKGAKYLSGHSYCTGVWYRFTWTKNKDNARRFADDDPITDTFRKQARAKVVHVQNSKRELKELGRRAIRHYPEEWGPSDNRRFSCSCGHPDPCHIDNSET